MRISKDAMTMMTTMRTARNIYKLLKGKVMGVVAYIKTNNDATKLWHMCLGHLSEHGMMELHKRNLLKGVGSFTIGLCRYYVLGKQCRVRFKIE